MYKLDNLIELALNQSHQLYIHIFSSRSRVERKIRTVHSHRVQTVLVLHNDVTCVSRAHKRFSAPPSGKTREYDLNRTIPNPIKQYMEHVEPWAMVKIVYIC